MQEITFYCKNCKKSLHMSYQLTGNDDALVLPMVFVAQQAGPDQRRADVRRPAVDHVAEHQQHEDAEIVALVLGRAALFGGQKQDRDAGDAEGDHLQEGEVHPAQHGKAVQHGCRRCAQQEKVPGLVGEFQFHCEPPRP